MEQKIVLTGIARSKGKAAGEAAVNRQRMGWAFNHVGNEDGIVLVPGADLQGQIQQIDHATHDADADKGAAAGTQRFTEFGSPDTGSGCH